MYNVNQIQEAFAGLVGFYQPTDPQYPKIENELTQSASGKYISRAHPLCTIENIFNSGPDFAGFVYGDETTVTQAFSRWLRDIYKNACSNLVSQLLKNKKINNVGKSLLDSQQLYSGYGMLSDRIIKHDRFVGVKIFTSKNENIALNINRLGFQVDTDQTLKFYLYHSSQSEPLKIIEFAVTNAPSFSWINLSDTVLSYMNGNQNSDGVFYFGYYESDLEGQAIKRDTNFSAAPCLSCSYENVAAYNAWSKYSAIASISVESYFLNTDRSLFDQSKIKYVRDTNFGINLSISAYCDLTAFFITNKFLFADALSMQVAYALLNEIAFSTRVNGIAAANKPAALADLGTSAKSDSFYYQYTQYLQALDIDFSGFDEKCLPCTKREGISINTI